MSIPHRLFAIPEILGIVTGLLENPQDVARLARVCRRFFNLCMPIAWRHVSFVMQIFNLLPDVNIATLSGGGAIIEIPGSLTEESLSRFHLYAPFISILDISKTGPTPWKLCNWNWLFMYSRTRPLLPKLQILTFTFQNLQMGSTVSPTPIWFTLFLSPSLLHFQALHRSSHLRLTTRLGYYFILRSLADTCPGLRTLGFFPADSYSTDSKKDTDWSHLLSDKEISSRHDLSPLFARLRCLTSLRTQRRGLESLSPDILSCLEWVDITISSRSPGNNQIPYTLLTSLKHLEVYKGESNVILKALPVSTVILTSIILGTKLDNDFIHQVTSRLAMYCPLLTDLSLHAALLSIQAASFSPLALITSLRRLCITHSKLVSPTQRFNVVSDINNLLPGLKTLELRDERSRYRTSQMLLLGFQGSSTIL
ncbi:hypothetical protein FRC12_013319 [Ceratobasidium sp. 428]|nr:hypothetical protein FRC12_013319 [Ceratobasidium sp. 428]